MTIRMPSQLTPQTRWPGPDPGGRSFLDPLGLPDHPGLPDERVHDPSRGRLIACTGARGGAGASVLSAALARAAVRAGLSCLLVDGDELGSGIDLLLGAEDAAGMRWPGLALARGDLEPGTLRQGLPIIDGIRVLAWDRAADAPQVSGPAVLAVLRSGLADHDLVVLDLSRGTGQQWAAHAAPLIDTALIVVPAEVRAVSAAAKVAAGVFPGVRDIRVVVRGPAPTGLTAGTIGSALGLSVAAQLRSEPGLPAALDRGEPPGLRSRGPLARACRSLLADLAIPIRQRGAPGHGGASGRGGAW
jgi:secretion/DNA translocation related CpaE-like protein